jgi:hypothetical protein
MAKSGKSFISIVTQHDFVASVWDPFAYRHSGSIETLEHYALIHKPAVQNLTLGAAPFQPIEYRHIPTGHYLSFALQRHLEVPTLNWPGVGEGEILFGTMRAYLGNILVTPLAQWIGYPSPLHFQVKSEFVVIAPFDELPYFWLAYLRSKSFLENLPLGSGGTRPRLQPHTLAQTPVTVPNLGLRQEIHAQLKELARQEWQTYVAIATTFEAVENQTNQK